MLAAGNLSFLRKFKLIVLVSLLLGATACNDWLSVLPENDQVADEYWQTKEEVEAVISSCYIKLRETVPQQIIWGEVRGNSISLTGNLSGDLQDLANWNILPENTNCQWGTWYKIINYANMIIQYAPLVADKDKSLSVAEANSYVGEAYYLRALSYFFLVRNFKDVPLITKPYMNDDQNYEIGKTDEELIWAQIVEDLKYAENNTKSYFSEPDEWATKGRATKWTVKATLADVYLWTKNYEQAIIKCNEVIASGRVGLIAGSSPDNENNWFTIFSEGNTNEGIFELQWDYSLGQSNTSLFNLFGSTSSNYIISPVLLARFQLSQDDIRALNATYTFNMATGLNRFWKYIGTTTGSNITATEMGITRTAQEKDQNWIMYRYADILFMKAEALVMQGPDYYEAAIEIINRIQKRAGVTNLAEILPTEKEMLDLVLNEKALEMAAEGKRWYDLLRISRISDDYLSYMIDEVLMNAAPNYAPIIQAKLQDRNSHYLPIYIDEITNNEALVQNPFYEHLN